jgi:callose synthase
MPEAPTIRKMFSFCVFTPYYAEDVMYDLKKLCEENKDGISILFYLQKIYPDEWQNFLERIGLTGRTVDTKVDEKNEEVILQLRLWASYRGQTLARTGVCRSPTSGYRAKWRLNPPILLQNFW